MIVAVVVLAGVCLVGLGYVAVRFGVIGVYREKMDRDGHLRLPGYNALNGRWSDEDDQQGS